MTVFVLHIVGSSVREVLLGSKIGTTLDSSCELTKSKPKNCERRRGFAICLGVVESSYHPGTRTMWYIVQSFDVSEPVYEMPTPTIMLLRHLSIGVHT